MRPIEIEMWANRVIDSMEQAGPTEDHRVELKSKWIEGNDAARRIAALANSAPDDTVLLLIGVDEKAASIIGVPRREMSEWWPQIESEFADRVAPEPIPLNMERAGIPFVAIAFKTDRAPYLVKNEAFGTKGHKIKWEVPYRIGNRTDTATRSQLLSLLWPALNLPQVELISAGVALYRPEQKKGHVQKCVIDVQCYIVPRDGKTITLDARACSVTVEMEELKLSPGGEVQLKRIGTDDMATNFMCSILGTSLLHIHLEGDVPSIGNHRGRARLVVSLRPIGVERRVSFICDLDSQPANLISGVSHSFIAQGLLLR